MRSTRSRSAAACSWKPTTRCTKACWSASTRDNDLTVNAIKGKQLTNFRASGKDDALTLTPAVKMSLEQALEFAEEDEGCVEVTPGRIRLRKE